MSDILMPKTLTGWILFLLICIMQNFTLLCRWSHRISISFSGYLPIYSFFESAGTSSSEFSVELVNVSLSFSCRLLSLNMITIMWVGSTNGVERSNGSMGLGSCSRISQTIRPESCAAWFVDPFTTLWPCFPLWLCPLGALFSFHAWMEPTSIQDNFAN